MIAYISAIVQKNTVDYGFRNNKKASLPFSIDIILCHCAKLGARKMNGIGDALDIIHDLA